MGGEHGATRADSVFIVLSPGASRLSVHIAGALRGDSVVGRWRAEAFGAGGGTGDVMMHHQSPAPR